SFFFYAACDDLDLHSFPTRRSSDLRSLSDFLQRISRRARASSVSQRLHWASVSVTTTSSLPAPCQSFSIAEPLCVSSTTAPTSPDRKSTRLNSSHVEISYAVFCLKK